MKSNLKNKVIPVLFSILFIGCQEMDVPLHDNHISELPIQSRSDPDPNCEMCPNSLPTCCCFVESVETTTDIDLHICGVIGNYGLLGESCSMDTGDGCYDVNNQGIHNSLTYLERQYFCIEKGKSFSLFNANGSGNGRIRVGCSDAGMPTGMIGENLSYSTGGFTRYFQSDSACDLTPCDY